MRKFLPILLFAGCCYGQVTVSGTASISGNALVGPLSATGAATPILVPYATPMNTGNNALAVPPGGVTVGSITIPQQLNFYNQGTGTSSEAIPISISNCSNPLIVACTGTGSLTVTSMAISGANASDFTLTGSCSTIASGADCEPTLTFHPTASAGTVETATLTVTDNGTTSTQTLPLTGVSATVTTLSACGALSSGVNYQLTGNVSAAQTCFTEGTNTNTFLNLNGHTITYCTASSSAIAAAVYMNGTSKGLTVYNGTIAHGAGTCTGTTTGSTNMGGGGVVNSSDGSTSGSFGTTLANLNITVADPMAKVLYEENGNATIPLSSIIHDVYYVDNDDYICGTVGCRAHDQGYPIVISDATNVSPTLIYNVSGIGGTQGGLTTTAAQSAYVYDIISPGNVTSTNSNGFAFQAWGNEMTVTNDLTTGAGTGGACLSCRGTQVGLGNVHGTIIAHVNQIVTQLPNNAEYGGCQGGGGYGMQINTAGSGQDLSDITFQDNYVVSIANACPAVGFSFSNATNGFGPSQIIGGHYEADLASGATATEAVGIQLIASEYSPYPNGSFTSTWATFLGDTSAVYNTASSDWYCYQCTFGTGTNPVSSGWLFFNMNNGLNVSSTPSSPDYFIDPTFTGGATKSQNNLATFAANNPGYTSMFYQIEWTYTVTVEKSSNSAPISGAGVSITDSTSTTECTGTTNGSGVYTCPVNDSRYAVTSGVYGVTNFNPLAIQITASGCTTGSYSETITATTSETKKLSGC